MPNRHREVNLPTWLWFFAAIPIGLVVVLLWQRRRVPPVLSKQSASPIRPRYAEPDSIPIDTRPPYDMGQMEEAYHAESAFEASHESKATKLGPNAVIRISPQPIYHPPVITKEDDAATSSLEPIDFENLQIIEGIGPKISGLLRENGITTFRILADTPLEELDQILADANLRRIANPGTWSEQAALAANGEWEKLKQLQDTLKAGRRKA
jgi:predicted flap endonuclease-1-like 5' DNA nuclease